MMQTKRDWVRLPSPWVQSRGLRELKWLAGQGANNIAALMALITIAHHVETDDGIAKVTYDDLCLATGLSRAKLSEGLKILENHKVVTRRPEGRSTYQLSNYNNGSNWGKIPARAIYYGKRISPFKDFKLRTATELNALKIFLVIAVMRSVQTNMTTMSYDKIEHYTGVERYRIRSAITLLSVIGLIHVNKMAREGEEGGMFNAYRIPHIDPYNHGGLGVKATQEL